MHKQLSLTVLSRSFISCGKLVLLLILILMPMLGLHGLAFSSSLVKYLVQFTLKDSGINNKEEDQLINAVKRGVKQQELLLKLLLLK